MPTRLAIAMPLLLVAACAQPPSSPTADADSLLARDWRLQAIGGEPVGDPPPRPFRIEADGQVTGDTGCNQFGGNAEVAGSRLRFGPLIATKRACAPAPMDQEDRFFAAMERVTGWRLDGSALHLLDDAGAVALRFEAGG